MNDTVAACRHPVPIETLLAYWLGETDEAATAAVDEHLLGCDACGARLDEIVALGGGVRAAVTAGLVSLFVTPDFVERLAAGGWRIRTERIARDGGVHCTIAPDDDAVAGRFEVPLAGVSRLDAIVESTLVGHAERLEDLPFDASRQEVVFMPSAAQLRRDPAHRVKVRLLAVDAAGERVLGEYRFDHRPWPTS